MKDYIEERVLALAEYIISTNSTVRAAAKKFKVSKSTVHKDVTERLQEISPSLAAQVKAVLDVNKAERHIRGGLATREKKKSNTKMYSVTSKRTGLLCNIGFPSGKAALFCPFTAARCSHRRR